MSTASNDIYKQHGLALLIGDFMMLGFPPNNVEQNVGVLADGTWKLSYLQIVSDMNEKISIDNKYDVVILIYGVEVGKFKFESIESLKAFASQLDAGVIKFQWEDMLHKANVKTGKVIKEPLTDDFYREEGLAVTISDHLVIGVHPDEVPKELSNLSIGIRKINYFEAFEAMMDKHSTDVEPYLMINYKGSLVSMITFVSFEKMGEFLKLIDIGVHPINWKVIAETTKKKIA